MGPRARPTPIPPHTGLPFPPAAPSSSAALGTVQTLGSRWPPEATQVPVKCPRYESLLGAARTAGLEPHREPHVSPSDTTGMREHGCRGRVRRQPESMPRPERLRRALWKCEPCATLPSSCQDTPHAARHVPETYHLNKQMKSYWTLWELERGVGHNLETTFHLSG